MSPYICIFLLSIVTCAQFVYMLAISDGLRQQLADLKSKTDKKFESAIFLPEPTEDITESILRMHEEGNG